MALLQIAEPGQSAKPHQRKLAVGIDLGKVYPVYATTVNINTLTIQSLQSMAAGGYIEVTMVNESVFPPIFAAIDIPQLWSTITGYETFNTQNNTWTPGSLATDWVTTTSQRTINSQAVDYVLYTRTGSPGATAQYRFLT